MYCTLNCGFFEHGAYVSLQEVNSMVQTPRSNDGASGNRLREQLQIFETLRERNPIYESLWRCSIRVSIGMSFKTIPDVDDGCGHRTSACRDYTLPREDPNSRIYARSQDKLQLDQLDSVIPHRFWIPLISNILSEVFGARMWNPFCLSSVLSGEADPRERTRRALFHHRLLRNLLSVFWHFTAVHWKSMCPKLREAFHKGGGNDFSDSDWLQHIHKGSKKTRLQWLQKIPRLPVVYSHFSGIHCWERDCSWVDGSCRHSIQMERIPVSPRMLSWCHFNPQVWTDSWRKRKQRGTTNCLLHTSQPVRGQSRWRRTQRRHVGAEKSTLTQQIQASSRRRPLDQLGESTRKGTAVLADKVSRHNCSRYSAGRLHRKSGMPAMRQNFIWKTLHSSAISEDCSQECLEIKAEAARAAAAGHTERLWETASGPNPRSFEKPLRGTELLVADAEHEFKVDLRMQGIPKDAKVEDQEKWPKFKHCGQATSWIPYRIDHCWFGEDRKSTRFSEESSRTSQELVSW